IAIMQVMRCLSGNRVRRSCNLRDLSKYSFRVAHQEMCMTLSNRLSYWVLGALAFALPACSSSDDAKSEDSGGTQSETVKVEVFSWWTAPGEAEALQSLIDLHKSRFPNARIYNAATDPKVLSGGTEAKAVLRERLEGGNPPDSFQTNAFELNGTYLSETPDLLQPLDDLFEEGDLGKDMVPELLADVTINEHAMAVPVNVHRENSLFYNISVFAEHGVEPPTTMAQFLDVCAKLKADGVTPLAISTSQQWIISKVFVALALGQLGHEKFVQYFIDKQPFEKADM